MQEKNRSDRRIQELFAAARRADGADAPPYRRPTESDPELPARRPWLPALTVPIAAGALTIAFALVLLPRDRSVEEPAPRTDARVLGEASARARAPKAPPAPAPKRAADPASSSTTTERDGEVVIVKTYIPPADAEQPGAPAVRKELIVATPPPPPPPEFALAAPETRVDASEPAPPEASRDRNAPAPAAGSQPTHDAETYKRLAEMTIAARAEAETSAVPDRTPASLPMAEAPGNATAVVAAKSNSAATESAEPRIYHNVLTLAPGGESPDTSDSAKRELLSKLATGQVYGVSNSLNRVDRARSLDQMLAVAGDFEVGPSTESYAVIQENEFHSAIDEPLSTFSIDVDTASYSNVRRFLTRGQWPPPDAVRIEEMINYFHYDYPAPTGAAPFSTHVEVADCPWNAEHRLVRIGLRGEEIERAQVGGSNLVFLIDTSGSMEEHDRLPLLTSALALLVDQLEDGDRVAIVSYAGEARVVLGSTPGSAKGEIFSALDELRAGGRTNGSDGIRRAYRIAEKNFIPGGINRVILATDGDFNVGVTDRGSLLRLVRKGAEDGIALTALGFGMGNYKDDMLELLADKGDGNYAYIDGLREARRVLVEELGGTLVTIARDVKIQVELNPAEVGAYRLIGYENRKLDHRDFNDDKKDAGEIGSGHTVTALYEIAPPRAEIAAPQVDPLKYQTAGVVKKDAAAGELLTVKVRYKEPGDDRSRLLERTVIDDGSSLDRASEDFKFAAAVAQLGMILRDSPHKGEATLEQTRALAVEGVGADERGRRSELIDLIRRASATDRN